MASSSEGHEGSGKESDSESVVSASDKGSGGSVVASEDLQYERFGADDPQRSERIAAVDGQAGAFLSELGFRMRRPEIVDPEQWRRFHRDAREREGWNQATSDVFKGILRLGNSAPPRSRRIL